MVMMRQWKLLKKAQLIKSLKIKNSLLLHQYLKWKLHNAEELHMYS